MSDIPPSQTPPTEQKADSLGPIKWLTVILSFILMTILGVVFGAVISMLISGNALSPFAIIIGVLVGAHSGYSAYKAQKNAGKPQ